MPENYELIQQGLRVTAEKLSLSEWEKMGAAIGRGFDNWHWAIGDWLLYGEEVLSKSIWPNTLQAGQSKYERAAIVTGLSIDTLEHCALVSHAYIGGDRVPGATWSRHRQAMAWAKEKRIEILRKSVEERWSTAEWLEALDIIRGGVRSHDPQQRGGSRAKGKIRCPHCGEWFRHKKGDT